MKVIINFEDRIEVLFLSKDTSFEDSRYTMEVPNELFAEYEKLEKKYATLWYERTKLLMNLIE